MTAAAIATTATVEAATITWPFCLVLRAPKLGGPRYGSRSAKRLT
jgi:hypothetical protein